MVTMRALEKAIESSEITLEGLAKSWIKRIAEDVVLVGGNLRDDLELYGKIKDKWEKEFNFEECDKTILYILTHPDEAEKYFSK